MKFFNLRIGSVIRAFVSFPLTIVLLMVGFLCYYQPVLAAYPGLSGKIAFISDRDRGGDYLDIYVTSPIPGAEAIRLTHNTGEIWDVHPAWSPDGTKITFARYDGNDYEIFVMKVDGSNVMQLTDNTKQDFEPAWSPDGLKIAYASGSSLTWPLNDWEIMIMNADGSQKKQLTDNTYRDVEPDWSPDGNKIAFEGDWELEPNGPGDAEIFIMNADGSNIVQITHNTISDFEPQWHPNGLKLVYSSRVFPGPEYYAAVCVIDLNTLAINQLTFDENHKWEPTWSPDGQKIAFQRQDGIGGDWEIVIINADGSGFTKLTDNQGWDLHPTWQRQPITAQAQIDIIIDAIVTLVEENVLESGNGNSLTAKLEAAEKQSSRGSIKVTINSLQAFINEINAYIKVGKLTPGIGQLLIDSSNAVIAQIINN